MADYPIRTRKQAFLAAIAGEGDMPTPKNRKEAILAKAGGADVDIEPKSGNEYWTLAAMQGGGSADVVIQKQTVTTQDEGYYKEYWKCAGQVIDTNLSEDSAPNALNVTFNGTKYICAVDRSDGVVYGATWNDDDGVWNFSNFPFAIFIDVTVPEGTGVDVLLTPSAETVTIKAVEQDVH